MEYIILIASLAGIVFGVEEKSIMYDNFGG